MLRRPELGLPEYAKRPGKALAKGGHMQNTKMAVVEADSSNGAGSPTAESTTGNEFLSHLARELHDGVIQNMWYLQCELNSIATRNNEDADAIKGELKRLVTLAQDAYLDLRSTLDTLHARSVEKISLKSELAELASKFSAATQMRVSFRSPDDTQPCEIDGESGKHVKRLVQEALWNSFQHSLGDAAEVSLSKSSDSLVIMVSDNGRGFDMEKVEKNHYGLRTMRERAQAINGRLYLSSSAGAGTTVTLRIPA
jgi:signal transduction histidine kinase